MLAKGCYAQELLYLGILKFIDRLDDRRSERVKMIESFPQVQAPTVCQNTEHVSKYRTKRQGDLFCAQFES